MLFLPRFPAPWRLAVPLLALVTAAMPAAARPAADAAPQIATRSSMILGCWSDADKGDSAELKLYFLDDGELVQYDENQVEKRKRTFGAWEMQADSTYLTVYWPAGNITSYNVKRIGPILHFSGINGVRNFTLRRIDPDACWQPNS